MTQYDLNRRSRPVVVLDYQTRWADEYSAIERELRALLGDAALAVDHIGSTSVPGLGAKDVIDVQITVADLDRAATQLEPLLARSFRGRGGFHYDTFYGMGEANPELRKLNFRELEGARRTHVHVREMGRFNYRYALLFRDYLRASREACVAYEALKCHAAQLFPENIDGYLFIKEPVLHLIYEAASLWAARAGWQPGAGTASR